ncbi:MAG: hypothetical protein ACRDHE_12135, partial [Ktedonobacterales bacterium]
MYAPQLAPTSGASLAAADADLRAHVEGCAWCQAKLASFDIVAAALKRHLGPPDEPRPHPMLADLITLDDRGDVEPRTLTASSGRHGAIRRWSGAAFAVACTLALILVAGGVFRLLPRQAGAPIASVTTTIPTATIAPTATPLPACAHLP